MLLTGVHVLLQMVLDVGWMDGEKWIEQGEDREHDEESGKRQSNGER